MLNQLIRQEALDGYTERWLGEVSELAAIPRILLAVTGVTMLGSLLAILILGSYTRHTTLVGVISGARQETVTAAVSAGELHAGQDLRIEVQAPGKVSKAGRARIISITASPPPGRHLYRIQLEVPKVCRRELGGHFLVCIPNERRHLYEWIMPCLHN